MLEERRVLEDMTSSNEKFEASYENVKESVKLQLAILGYDLSSAGLVDTPDRVSRMFFTELYVRNIALKDVLSVTFDEGDRDGTDDLVCMDGIKFSSWCEHHMLPFWGDAFIAYVPSKRVVGISKLVRLVRAASTGLNIQERITHDVADALDEYLEAKGVLVVTKAVHSCMIVRGVKGFSESLTVSAVKGLMKDSGTLRSEALSLLGLT